MTNQDTSKISWYHGKVSREAAEQILENEELKEDGLFLVRQSNTSAGDYGLSVWFQGEVVHYQIRRHGEDAFFSIDEQTITHGLETLIEYYQEQEGKGLICCLTKFVKKDPPPNDSRRHGRTNLLHRATKEGDYNVVCELIKYRYQDIESREAKNQDGQTVVHLASQLGHDEILHKFIEDGANVNCRDTEGYTPLHYACQRNLPSTVRILINVGKANVQLRNTKTGWVPLHEAASGGHKDVVLVLLALNTPLRPRTEQNETPAELAKQAGHLEVERILQTHKCAPAKSQKLDWYHGTLDRLEAVAILKRHGNKDGSFLVRISSGDRKGFVLTMVCAEQAFHFQIRKQGDFYFIDDGPYLDSLEHVIDHYTGCPDGLPTTLQSPAPPSPKPPLPEQHPSLISNTHFATLPNRRRSDQISSLPTSDLIGAHDSDRHSLRRLSGSNPGSESFGRSSLRSTTSPLGPESLGRSSLRSTTSPLGPESLGRSPLGPESLGRSSLRSTTSPLGPESLGRNSLRSTKTSPRASHPAFSSMHERLMPVHNRGSPCELGIPETRPPCPALPPVPAEEFIPEENIILKDKLGEGEFGSVYRGILQSKEGIETDVAVKTLRKEHMSSNKNEFLREARIMMELRHHCIVKLINISLGSTLLMVQELAPLGSMLTYIQKNPDQVTEFELKLWASQIAFGMQYLEEQRCVHRDLAARNILLSSKHQAKISDFGLSRVINTEQNVYMASQGGKWPIKWYAPESYNKGQFSSASDVWSFGVTLWEMYSYGQQPYHDRKGVEVVELIDRGERLPCPEKCSLKVYQTMEQCWAMQPRDRPTFSQLATVFSPDYINIKELVPLTHLS